MSKFLATAVLSAMLLSTAASAAPTTKPTAKSPRDAKQYCLTFANDTGSRITRTECRTKKEWQELDIDVDQLSAKGSQSGGLA